MDYNKLAAEYEKGVDWASWDDAPEKLVMQNRLIALSQLAAYHAREAERIKREQEQLSDLLMAM
jgi:hypothetical protein